MKWTAEADLVVGLAFVSGKRKLGVGFGIGRRKVIKNVGIDLGEHLLRRCCVFFLKNSTVLSLNWSLETRNSVYLDRGKAMKRSNVFNLLLQMMPSSHQAVVPSSPDHWAFLEEVDAPQWADLVKEAALMGTLGDDPWFHRCHMHHETSLARAANFATVVDSNGSSVEMLERQQQQQHPTTRKGPHGGGKGGVSKLIKPALKGNVVKACLGMQRVSSGGGSNVGGRLSSRPRRSTSLSRSVKPIKKVNIIHRPGGGLVQQQQQNRAGGSDPRVAQSEPSSTVGTPKKSFEGKTGNRRSDSVLNVSEAAQKMVRREGGETPVRNHKSVGSVSEIDDTSVNDLSSSSIPLYRLPSPLSHGVGDFSAEMVRLKSSPSDMALSSRASPAHSISSQESLVRGLSSSAAEVARLQIAKEGSRLVKGRRSNVTSSEAPELHSRLPLNGEITEVGMNEPHLEISSFKGADGADSTSTATTTTTGLVDWNQQGTNPGVVKRSLGPPMRVKQIEKVGSSSAKKKTSKVINNNNNNNHHQDGGAPAEKATHPILEKLRKSWGSALRVKQRQEAEGALSDTRSDSSAEQHSGELKGNNVLSLRKQWEQAQKVQSEVLKRTRPGAATTTTQPPTEREVLIRNIITRERRAAINQQHQQPQLQLTTDIIEAPDSPSGSGLSANGATDNTIETAAESKTSAAAAAAAPNAAKVGLAKIQANYQRSKSDAPSKFKKQYVHEAIGVSKSLSMQRGNKENMQLEVKVKGQTSPPSGLGWKRKPAVPRRQLSPRQPGTALNGVRSVPQAAARTNAHALPMLRPSHQTSPHARSSVNFTKSDTFVTSTKSVGQDAADASVPKSQPLYKGANNLGLLRGSTSSVLKLTKQKSERIPSKTVKETYTNAAGPKACKSSVQVADESVVIAAEDRKSKAASQYEPRLHGVKAIKEWENKSGKRYYDLQPLERKKANEEITASSKTVVTKRSSA